MSIYLFLLCASVLPETFLLCSKKQTPRFPPCFSLPHLIRIAVLVLDPSTRFQKETPVLLSGQQCLEQGFLLSGLSPGTKGRNRSWTLKIMAMVDIIHMCPRGLVPPLPPTAGSFLVSSAPPPPTPVPILSLLRTNQHVPSQWLWNFPCLPESQHCLTGSVACIVFSHLHQLDPSF